VLRIALPNKGRLQADVIKLLDAAGLEVRSAGERALTAKLGDEFTAIFVRAQDIPELVDRGAADAGVTGRDLVLESGATLDDRLDLGFGRCRLVIAAREGAFASVDAIADGTRVASVFPRLAARAFAERGRAVVVVPVSGAAEVSPHLGIADVIVDLTSTGSTLRTNGLVELATVLESSARLVARPRAEQPEEKARALDELELALASVVRAQGQRYLMANVPRDSLPRVRAILPGLNGPTVVDVAGADGRFVAVHAVVPGREVYRTIARLKELGGEGILVTRIERLTP
jgi:ATP phosphoribosyltransferase